MFKTLLMLVVCFIFIFISNFIFMKYALSHIHLQKI